MSDFEGSPSSSELVEIADRLERSMADRKHAQSEIDKAAEEMSQALEARIGETLTMEGEANRYLPPASPFIEDNLGMSAGFEDHESRNVTVTTGFRPMTVLHVGKFGVTVDIEDELKRPILHPESIRFSPHG